MTPAEIERLRAERDENEGAFKVWRRRCQEAERELDEARVEAEARQQALIGAQIRHSHAYVSACRERDDLRALLRECRPYLWHNEMNRPGNDLALLLARLDAVLAGEVSR